MTETPEGPGMQMPIGKPGAGAGKQQKAWEVIDRKQNGHNFDIIK